MDNLALHPQPSALLSQPCGRLGAAGDDVIAATSSNRAFSTIHNPYCSLFLLDLQREKEAPRYNP